MWHSVPARDRTFTSAACIMGFKMYIWLTPFASACCDLVHLHLQSASKCFHIRLRCRGLNMCRPGRATKQRAPMSPQATSQVLSMMQQQQPRSARRSVGREHWCSLALMAFLLQRRSSCTMPARRSMWKRCRKTPHAGRLRTSSVPLPASRCDAAACADPCIMCQLPPQPLCIKSVATCHGCSGSGACCTCPRLLGFRHHRCCRIAALCLAGSLCGPHGVAVCLLRRRREQRN